MADGLMQDRNGKWLKVGDWCYIDYFNRFTPNVAYRLIEHNNNDLGSCAFYNHEKEYYWFCWPSDVTYAHSGVTQAPDSQIDDAPAQKLWQLLGQVTEVSGQISLVKERLSDEIDASLNLQEISVRIDSDLFQDIEKISQLNGKIWKATIREYIEAGVRKDSRKLLDDALSKEMKGNV